MLSSLAVAVLLAVSAPKFPAGAIEIGDVGYEELSPVVQTFADRVNAGDKVILFRINSFGGSIFAGMDFIDLVTQVKRVQGIKVQCLVGTKAMSMGLVILESEMCDERYALPHSVFLAHNGSSGGEGTAEQLRESAAILTALNAAMAQIIGSRLFMGPAAYSIMVAKHAWVFAGPEALAVGAIDALVRPESVPPLY